MLPALVSQGIGATAPLAFILCGLMMALVVTALAMAGSRVASTGGIYAYVETAFGPFAGFLAGVLLWLTGVLAVSGVASALLDQAATLAPVLLGRTPRTAVIIIVFSVLAAVNVRGVRSGARVIEVVTAAKLIPLTIFVAAGIFFISPAAIAWPGLPDANELRRAVLLLIFAYSGAEIALVPSGEVNQPARTVPRALFLALTVTTILYISIQLVAQGVLGSDLSRFTLAPLAEAASRFLGASGRLFLLLGAVCSMFGYLCGDMLSSPRSLYAIARDGFLPGILARVHPGWRTPHVAIWTHAFLVVVFASTNTFESLAIVSNVGLLLMYLLCCGAALELTRRDVRTNGAPFSPRGGFLAPVLGATLVIWILSTATRAEFTLTGVVLVIASIVYWVQRGRLRRSVPVP